MEPNGSPLKCLLEKLFSFETTNIQIENRPGASNRLNLTTCESPWKKKTAGYRRDIKRSKEETIEVDATSLLWSQQHQLKKKHNQSSFNHVRRVRRKTSIGQVLNFNVSDSAKGHFNLEQGCTSAHLLPIELAEIGSTDRIPISTLWYRKLLLSSINCTVSMNIIQPRKSLQVSADKVSSCCVLDLLHRDQLVWPHRDSRQSNCQRRRV